MVDKYDYYPSEDNTKAEIKAYMDDADIDYSSSDTKAELLEKLMQSLILLLKLKKSIHTQTKK